MQPESSGKNVSSGPLIRYDGRRPARGQERIVHFRGYTILERQVRGKCHKTTPVNNLPRDIRLHSYVSPRSAVISHLLSTEQKATQGRAESWPSL